MPARNLGAYRIQVGGYAVTALYDGMFPFAAQNITGISEAEVGERLHAAFGPPEAAQCTPCLTFSGSDRRLKRLWKQAPH